MKLLPILIILLIGTNPAFSEEKQVEITVYAMEREGVPGFWVDSETFALIDQSLNYLIYLDEEYDKCLESRLTLKETVERNEQTINDLNKENTSLLVQRNIAIGVGLGLVGISVLGGLFLW